MLATLLGPECFRQGSDLYFQRHDGLAATTEDFIAAMEFTSGRDLSQFKRWYSQAGTPRAMINGQYDTELKQFAITVKQTCPTTPENPVKKSFHLPLVMSLIGQKNALPLYLKSTTDDKNHPKQPQGHHTMVLEVTEPEQTFTFEQINEKPVPSLFQDFSAPVKWSYDYSNQDLALILRVGTNDFCRWEASQILWVNIIHQTMNDLRLGNVPEVPAEIITLYHELLEQVENKPNTTQALVTQLLTLPSEAYLSELAESIDVVAIHQARRSVKKTIGHDI
jgi:aminopeptidase N